MKKHFGFMLTALCLLLFCSACEQRRTPMRYLVPKGYVGWVVIIWSSENSENARVVDGKLEIKFNKSGIKELRNHQEFGSASDDYFSYDEASGIVVGTLNNIGQRCSGSADIEVSPPKKVHYSAFYVGKDPVKNPSITVEDHIRSEANKGKRVMR